MQARVTSLQICVDYSITNNEKLFFEARLLTSVQVTSSLPDQQGCQYQ